MNKYILTFLFSSLLLTSCGETSKHVTTVPANSINGQVVTEVPKKVATASGDIEAMKEQQQANVLKALTPEESALITELTTAQKDHDRMKQEDVMKKIRTYEDTKRKELNALDESGDMQKSQELRKSLYMFHMAQENMR